MRTYGQFLVYGLILASLLASPQTATLRFSFDAAKDVSEHSWTLKELGSGLDSDWSSYNFAVLELRASSAQAMKLSVETSRGPASITLLPYQNAWIRAAIPLAYFEHLPTKGTDMASISNKSHFGYFVHLTGPYLPLQSVSGISVSMAAPLGTPVLEIRSVRLTRESPGDAVLEPHPSVDGFGQWFDAEWPGKVKSLEQLRSDWRTDENSLAAGDFGYDRFGGYRNTEGKATGFFHVEQIEGRWWFVDPDGHLFFSTGADETSSGIQTLVEGRRSLFTTLPPQTLSTHSARPGASFLTWNIFRRFGDDWQEKWTDLTIRRMNAWGLNTTGNWSAPQLWASGRIAYTVPLSGWQTKVTYMGMPDIYSDEFASACDIAAAKQCVPRAADRYLLGYFTANEPPWPGREAPLTQEILDGPATATQRELKKYLAEGDTPERRKAFVYQAYAKYLEVICSAVKRHDPNHLNLGMRFAGGRASDEMIRASRIFDVYSLNSYEMVPKREMLEHAYELTGRPLLIGEFHFGTPGHGLSAGLKQVRDDHERGVAYRYYVENAAAMPALIGAHWFQWMDEPNTGRFDGENYNIGFIDVTDRPYTQFVAGVQQTERNLQAVHSGKLAPSQETAKIH